MEVIDLCSNLFSPTSSQSSSNLIHNENEINTINLHSLPILLRNCVLEPIRSHSTIVNRYLGVFRGVFTSLVIMTSFKYQFVDVLLIIS